MTHFHTCRKKGKIYILTGFAHLDQVNKHVFWVRFFLIQFQQREALINVLNSQVIKCENRDTDTEKFLNYRNMIYKELERNLSKTRVRYLILEQRAG